jgi:hypothetical protein
VAQIDLFANQLLEEAKRFLEKAKECSSDPTAEAANLHAALMLSFCALEAHVNAIGQEFSGRPELSAHERGMLLEQEVKLEGGEFQLKAGLRMAKLEDRIEFLHAKFSGKSVDRSSTWWSELGAATSLRNQLTHARDVPAISQSAVRSAIQAIIDVLEALYQAIYKRKFPPANRGLQSRLSF